MALATAVGFGDGSEATFATLLDTVTTYCHARADAEDYEALMRRARHWSEAGMLAFRDELRRALRDPSQLPAGVLACATGRELGSAEDFLHQLWCDLYGIEQP